MDIGAGLGRAAESLGQAYERVRDFYDGRPWLLAASAALSLLVLSGAILALTASSLVEGRVRDRAAAMGFAFAARDVDMGLASVAFDGVSVHQEGAKAPVLRAERLHVAVSLFGLLQGGSAAVREVTLESPTIELDVPALVALRAGQKKRAAAEATSAGAQSLPRLRVRAATLRVRDEHGILVHADGIDGEVADGRFSAELAALEIGALPSDVITVKGAAAEGSLQGRRPVLEQATTSSATLTWAADAPDAKTTSLSRLLAIRDGLRTEALPDAAEPRARAALWSEDAKLALKDMRILSREADGSARTMLEGLTASVEAKGEGVARLTGSGKAPGDGAVGWDLEVTPREARVEGHVSLDDVSLALFAPVLPRLPFSDLDRTRVDADLDLAGKGLESVAVRGRLSLSDLTFADAGLSRLPVGPFALEAEGEGAWNPSRRELSIAKSRVKVSAAEVTLKGVLAWPADGYRVDIDAELKKTLCRDVLGAIPAGLLDDLAAVALEGHIAGKLLMHVDATDLDATKVDFDIDDACKFVAVPPVLDLMRFEQPFLHTVLEPDGSVFELETGPGTASWTPIELVSAFMIQSVVAHEDGRFFGHHGFAEPEIAVALSRNLKAKAFKFGASTITMQLVKNVFLHRDKLLARKVQEALIVWWLEQQWDKRRILQLYLNVIEYGPGIYGIRNAAWHYFGTIPMNLTPAQSAFLAAVLPSPKTFHEQYEKGQLSSSMKSRMATFMKHLAARERIDTEALGYGLEELEGFTFYDPDKPPPPPPMVRGTAQSPPFDAAAVPYDAWDVQPVEDGSFGP